MNDRDLVADAIRQANPRPSGSNGPAAEWTAAELLAQIEARSETMPTKRWNDVRRSARARWLVGAAAFATVLVVGMVALPALRGGEEVSPAMPVAPAAASQTTTEAPTTTKAPSTTSAAPAAASQTTTEATSTTKAPSTTSTAPAADPEALAYAEGLVADLNAGDVAAAHARFPASAEFPVDAEGLGRSIRSKLGLLTWFEYAAAMESRYELGVCRTSFDVTTCEVHRTSAFEPFAPLAQPIRYAVRLESGVPAFTTFIPQPGAWTTAEFGFMSWLAENHPGVAQTLYNNPQAATSYQNMNDAAVEAALKREYVPLWIDNTG